MIEATIHFIFSWILGPYPEVLSRFLCHNWQCSLDFWALPSNAQQFGGHTWQCSASFGPWLAVVRAYSWLYMQVSLLMGLQDFAVFKASTQSFVLSIQPLHFNNPLGYVFLSEIGVLFNII